MFYKLIHELILLESYTAEYERNLLKFYIVLSSLCYPGTGMMQYRW